MLCLGIWTYWGREFWIHGVVCADIGMQTLLYFWSIYKNMVAYIWNERLVTVCQVVGVDKE